MRHALTAALLLPFACAAPLRADTRPAWLRFPATHATASSSPTRRPVHRQRAGGTARKLTSTKAFEMFPRFSPDGKWLAFTGQVRRQHRGLLMPAEGGTPNASLTPPPSPATTSPTAWGPQRRHGLDPRQQAQSSSARA